MKGLHEPYDGPVLPERKDKEDALSYIRRICEANGWKAPEYKPSPRETRDRRTLGERLDAIFKPVEKQEPREPGADG